jgi:LssY C-terminus
LLGWLLAAVVVYAGIAYLVMPSLWRRYEHQPGLEAAPETTTGGDGLPGDPLNIALIGSEAEVVRALLAAKWHPADPITFRTSLAIALSVLLHRPDPDAPVSSQYLWGRRQDLAFEKSVGGSARRRHHVRLWRSNELAADGRPTWLGAATFDRGVGFGHRTGEITHHIAPDVDAERDALDRDLVDAGQVTKLYRVSGVGPTLWSRNSEGDRYYTDGDMIVLVLTRDNVPHVQPPQRVPSPPAVAAKNAFFAWLRGWLGSW